MTVTPLESFPKPEEWDDYAEFDPVAWPKKIEQRYTLVPTICFNCEAACGLMAYVDKESFEIRKLEGNPYHPGSRGKNCAKGPATINQVRDPHRILYPLKRSGPRGSGQWERTTWDDVLDTFAAEIRAAIQQGRRNEIMYHVGRPGEDGFVNRVLAAWGCDAHNSHTNVCSSSARVGYALWSGSDRPSPDHANAKFILMLSAHLETGHYFNPHAQRIIEAKKSGAKICVVDVRLSNTASKADWWLAPWPGSEPWLLLALAKVLLDESLYNREFVDRWVNWEETLSALKPGSEVSFDAFIDALRDHYAYATPEAAEEQCGVPSEKIIEIAREIGHAGSAIATHVWRNAAAGNLGGWQVARCLEFIAVLMGAVGTRGGTNLNSDNKFVPPTFLKPPSHTEWNELLYPREYPLAYHELSYLLPHFLEDSRGKISAYFTRVYNPVWTNPDGMMWERMLTDETKVKLHAALTPVWNETAQYADFVLPMGNGAERHDLMSQETHASKWIGFRQPVQRVARERAGGTVELTRDSNPGEVWEETEFWIELSWRIDPDGSLGVRQFFESPYRPHEKITIREYYQWIFENSVPGLPDAASKLGLTPYEFMSKFGAFEVDGSAYATYPDAGFRTPSKKLELFSATLRDWEWEEHAMPGPIKGHVHKNDRTPGSFEFILVPTFRLPTLIHTRTTSKWLYELSNSNPVWMHPEDAATVGVDTGDLVRVATQIGHYVNRVWVTEGMRPGVVACSHHLGRWRVRDEDGTDPNISAMVSIDETSPGVYKMSRKADVRAYASDDPDTSRVWWTDGGVHQNLIFPVQPDPVSGQHCWHQRVVVSKAGVDDRYGDVVVDTNKSMEVYREWLALTRPAPGPGGLRRPLWFDRVNRPADDLFYIRDA
jgi:anaerobic selenocysteine-containing dehydrogenase